MAIDVQQQQIPAGTWKLDTVHSSVGFAVRHMVVATFRGTFREYDASIEDGVLRGTVQAGSIDVRDENLAAHLKAPDFFDVERTPEITFVSTGSREHGGELLVEGELTIKGVTRPVTARGAIVGPHEDIAGNTKVGVSLQTVVDRTAFGLDWNAPLPKGGVALSNDVTLIVELELLAA